MFKGLLFDFDGVLGKTMEDNYLAWAHAFQKFDLGLDQHEYFLMEGMRSSEIIARVLRDSAREDIMAADIASLKESYYSSYNNFQLYPQVLELLQAVKKRSKVGLVTGASQKRLAITLEKTKLNQFFDCIVTAEDVSRGKPAPDPYLQGLKEIGLDRNECAVIENAPLGIESAKTAGLFCIGICSTLGREYLQQADIVFDSIAELGLYLGL